MKYFVLLFLLSPGQLFAQPEFTKSTNQQGEVVILFKDGYEITQKNYDESERLTVLATEHWRNDELELAKKEIEQAILLNKNNYKAWSRKGTLQEDESAAINCFNKALSINPGYYIALHNRGIYRFEMGQYQEAIHDYDQVIATDPKYVSSYYSRGKAKSTLGDSKGAIQDFTAAIKLDSTLVDAWEARSNEYLNDFKFDSMDVDNYMVYKLNHPLQTQGNQLCKKGNLKGAISKYKTAVTSGESPETAYMLMAIAHHQLNMNESAIQDVGKAQQVYQKEALKSFSPPMMVRDDSEDTVEAYTEEIKKDPENEILWQRRADIKKEQGDASGAIQDYTEALRLSGNLVEITLKRGDAYIQTGKFSEAITDIKHAIELCPHVDNRDKWLLCSKAQLLNGQLSAGFESYFEAVRNSPALEDAWLLESVIFHLSKKPNSALLALNKYEKQMDYNHPDLLFFKAWLIQKSDRAAAIKALKSAIEGDPTFNGALVCLLNKLNKE